MTVLCDYCGKPAKLVAGAVIYPHRPDLSGKRIWSCDPCGAYVGVHDGTIKPLGRLANAELRAAKCEAHAAFDPLWRAKIKRDGCSKGEARGKGYRWLAKSLGIAPADCHIGMMDVDDCRRVVEACARRLPA